MTLALFDIVILTIISISSLFGLYKGMIQIVINFVGFVASIVVAILLYPKVKVILASYFNNDLIISIASGVSSYIFSLIVFTFICSSLVMMVSAISQGWLDRLLGLVVGFIRGVLISTILFGVAAIFATASYSKAKLAEDVVLDLCEDDYPEWLKIAVATPYLDSILKDGVKLIPSSILNKVKLPSKNTDGVDIIDTIKNAGSEADLSVEKLLPNN